MCIENGNEILATGLEISCFGACLFDREAGRVATGVPGGQVESKLQGLQCRWPPQACP